MGGLAPSSSSAQIVFQEEGVATIFLLRLRSGYLKVRCVIRMLSMRWFFQRLRRPIQTLGPCGERDLDDAKLLRLAGLRMSVGMLRSILWTCLMDQHRDSLYLKSRLKGKNTAKTSGHFYQKSSILSQRETSSTFPGQEYLEQYTLFSICMFFMSTKSLLICRSMHQLGDNIWTASHLRQIDLREDACSR